MVKERQDITGLNCIKGASGKVIVDDKGIKDCWKDNDRLQQQRPFNGL